MYTKHFDITILTKTVMTIVSIGAQHSKVQEKVQDKVQEKNNNKIIVKHITH